MKRRTGAVAYLQYLAVRSAAFVLTLFPVNLNLRTARWLGRMWWRLDRRHRLLAFEQLRASFDGQYSDPELRTLVRRSFEHWTMFAVEVLSAMRLLTLWTWPRYARPVDMRDAFKLMTGDGGTILLTAHYGNFDLSAYALSAIGFDSVAVMRPLDNVYLNNYVMKTRSRHGLQLLSKFGASSDTESVLRRGGSVSFVADQDAGRKGVFVDFFGRPASTYKSIALLAISCEVPVIVAYSRRIGDRFQYDVGVNRIIYPHEWRDRADPVAWITQEYTAAIERFIREVPEQYLWIHRRWKSSPRERRGRRA